MKKLISLLLAAVMLTGSLPAALAASDTSDSVIEQVVRAAEIMVGDSSGNMNLGSTVTRAEYAKMLVCASTSKDSVAGASNSSLFKDVPYTHWAAGYIKTAVQQGWLTGYLDGSFRPAFVVAVDVATEGLLGAIQGKYHIDLCIDHHGTNTDYADRLLLDDGAAAASEIIYKVIREMERQP